MNWLEVQSSNVAAIAYDADIYMLAIRYRDGSVYICPNVSPTAFGTLATAESKGKFLASLRMSSQAIRIRKGWELCGAPAKAPSETERTEFIPSVRHWRIKAAFAVTHP